MTKLQICNKALRLLGLQAITQTHLDNDSNEQARILNDIYTSVRDEVLKVHPWNFAIKRAELTELGGTITTWTDNGSNVWYATLATAPSSVEFDGIEGTEVASAAACTAARYWYHDADNSKLYVYSTSDPDDAYTTVDAVIPEFEFDHAYSLPSDCLRVIKMEDDDSQFVVEGSILLTNEEEAKIKYIAQITTDASFPSDFVMAFAQKLAAEMTIPTTSNPRLAVQAFALYKDKLSEAKSIDAQEGSAEIIDEDDWENARG